MARSQLHVVRLADIVPDLPIIAEWIDNPDRVARLLPRVSQLAATEMITIEDIEIVNTPIGSRVPCRGTRPPM